jgi:hypothetical protein
MQWKFFGVLLINITIRNAAESRRKKKKRIFSEEINNWSIKIDFTWPRDDEFISATNLLVE